jgi:hypothetical protein
MTSEYILDPEMGSLQIPLKKNVIYVERRPIL